MFINHNVVLADSSLRTIGLQEEMSDCVVIQFIISMILKAKADQNNWLSPRTAKQALSPVIKTNPLDMMPIMSLRDFRSASRSKGKLKLHVFNNKKPEKETHIYQKNQNEIIKNYSSLSSLPYESPRNKLSVQEYLLAKGGPLPKKIQKQKAKKMEQPVKQKREFKLIREIKKQKAIKVLEQGKKLPQEQGQYKMGGLRIEGSNQSKIHAFVQEIHKVFEPSPAASTQQSRVEKVEKSSSVIQSKLQASQQYLHTNIPQQSIVNIEMPQKSASIIMEEKPASVFKEEIVMVQPKVQQTEYKQPNLGRSVHKASRILKERRDSCSSIDVTIRESKVRAEISISLALQSKRGSKINLSVFYKDVHFNLNKGDKITCNDKLNAHLQILQSMSLFVYQSLKFDQIGDEWQELNFLIFKKFYIERKKVLNFLQKYPMKNPFCIYNAQISSKEVIQFMKTEEGKKTLADLVKETNLIKQKLVSIYSKFDKGKVGEKINLYEYDNFSHWIIEQLWAQLILTEHNTNHDKEVIHIRLCRILQLIFLISELNGKFQFSFEQAQTAIEEKQYLSYIKEGKDIFQKYILYKSEDSEILL